MSNKLTLSYDAYIEVRNACSILRERFPQISPQLDKVETLVRKQSPFAAAYFDNALRSIPLVEWETDISRKEKKLCGRAVNWLQGAKYLPPLGSEGETIDPDELTQWRKGHKFSEAQAAEKMGVSVEQWRQWEIGSPRAPGYLFRALNDIDNEISADELLGI